MFKRARWIGAGAALGAGGTVWLQRKLKLLAGRYRPAGIAGEAVGKAAALPGSLRDAFTEGRDAMREREDELRRTHLRPSRRSRHR